MGYVLILYNWKEYIYHTGCSFSIQSILENGLILGGQRTAGRYPEEEGPVMITQFLKMCTITVIGNVIKMPFTGKNYPEHKSKDCNFDKQSHAIIVHSLVPAECIYTEKQFAIAAATAATVYL